MSIDPNKKVPVAIVTGATGAIGFAISRKLAALGLKVVMVSRDPLSADKAAADIRKETDNKEVYVELVDVSKLSSIKDFVKRWQGPLNVLINNAATAPREKELNQEGLELQFATNILGYVRFMIAFESIMAQSDLPRVINIASYWAGDLVLDDLQFKTRRYHGDIAYRQSKQANRMLSIAFSNRWHGRGISVNACHPGDVSSKLSNNLGFGGHETPDQGAETPVWLATQPVGLENTGMYFERKHIKKCSFSHMHDAIEDLYQHCLSFC